MVEQKAIIYGLDGKEKESIELPKIFSISPRRDLISRVVVSLERNEKQPQGRDPQAGKRNTARTWGSGFATARVPRRQGSGYPSARNAAFAPNVVGGRATHPPRTNKIYTRKVNSKERKLALCSAISATGQRNLVETRGHKITNIVSFPLVVDDKIQGLKKTSEVLEVFEKLALIEDINRAKNGKKIRAGRGKSRGRRYKVKKSLLIVTKDSDLGIEKSARNIAGVDVVNINHLNCKNLAPGAQLGRLTLWTQSAFKQLDKMGGL